MTLILVRFETLRFSRRVAKVPMRAHRSSSWCAFTIGVIDVPQPRDVIAILVGAAFHAPRSFARIRGRGVDHSVGRASAASAATVIAVVVGGGA